DISNPATANVPPSTWHRPVRQPQDLYAGGGAANLIVTGEVAGGRHFRGFVPYTAITGFGARTGTETMDAFARATHGAGYTIAPGAAQQYQMPSRAVSRLPEHGVAAPAATAIGMPLEPLAPPRARPAATDFMHIANRHRPLAMTQEELMAVVSHQPPASQTETAILKAINDIRQRQLLEELEKIRAGVAELAAVAEQRRVGQVPARPAEPAKPLDVPPLRFPEQATLETPEARPADIHERLLQQLERDSEDLANLQQPATPAAEDTGLPPAEKTALDEMLRSVGTGKPVDPDKFNEDASRLFMDLGDEYIAQRRFYRAAHAYALARLYKPDSARSFAGQSWALFAAGEYMSSAFFLGRAVELDPEAAARKVDLAALIGGELAQNRLTDLEAWQRRTHSSELQFLLAYVNYQMGRLRDAEDEIRAVAVKMEDYKPAAILRDIIVAGQQ
ncbi:MAG TPA: hypothetical protein VLH60_05765, partial [Sedimentisphaerales bacterium]|nr:hypothetical protein [Sedimentisphaerales bacterium]